MKDIKTTLEDVELTRERRNGNSTRQVDKAIQYLYEGYKILVLDHWENGSNNKCNKLLFKGILDRLAAEHHLNELIRSKRIEIYKKKLTIEFV